MGIACIPCGTVVKMIDHFGSHINWNSQIVALSVCTFYVYHVFFFHQHLDHLKKTSFSVFSHMFPSFSGMCKKLCEPNSISVIVLGTCTKLQQINEKEKQLIILELVCCKISSVSDPDPDLYWIQIQSGQWIRIRIRNPDLDPEGPKWPTKVEKNLELSCFEVLDVLIWELKASSVTWTSFMEA